jgi:hypothetical protein
VPLGAETEIRAGEQDTFITGFGDNYKEAFLVRQNRFEKYGVETYPELFKTGSYSPWRAHHWLG